MNSQVTSSFRAHFGALPPEIKREARIAYQHFAANPRHPGLQFKRVGKKRPVYSVRITRDYRALGVVDGDTVIWY